MELRDIRESTPELWSKVWNLYEDSFPAHERRSREAQLKAFDDPDAYGRIVMDEDGELAAILFYWLYESNVYVEFLAVDPRMRGRNIGTAVVEKILALHPGCTVILEIEPPEDEITLRRLHFYERLGFVANDYHYVHPSYRTGDKAFAHRLTLMTHGSNLAPDEFQTFRRFMESTVLKYSD